MVIGNSGPETPAQTLHVEGKAGKRNEGGAWHKAGPCSVSPSVKIGRSRHPTLLPSPISLSKCSLLDHRVAPVTKSDKKSSFHWLLSCLALCLSGRPSLMAPEEGLGRPRCLWPQVYFRSASCTSSHPAQTNHGHAGLAGSWVQRSKSTWAAGPSEKPPPGHLSPTFQVTQTSEIWIGDSRVQATVANRVNSTFVYELRHTLPFPDHRKGSMRV